MKATDQNKLTTLGKLQAIHEMMNSVDLPSLGDLSTEFLDVKRRFWKITDQQWDKANELLTEDDT